MTETYFDGENELKVIRSNRRISYYLGDKLHRSKKHKLHRLDGPAFIEYYENGNILSETFFVNGKSHRLDGPAEIWYSENGIIEREEYWVNGKYIDTECFPNIDFENWPLSLEDQILLKMSV